MIKECSPACLSCKDLEEYFDPEEEEEADEGYDAPETEVERGETVAIPWGVPQNVGITFQDKVHKVLAETSRYMTETVYEEDRYDEVFAECENRVEDCSHWAALGKNIFVFVVGFSMSLKLNFIGMRLPIFVVILSHFCFGKGNA